MTCQLKPNDSTAQLAVLGAPVIRQPSKRHLALMGASEGDRERFWLKVNKGPHENGCWIWEGQTSKKGYGIIWIRGGMVRAHRLSFLIANGHIDESLLVCHKCDNPSCINPAHLFLGTVKDNTMDAASKGRLYGQSKTHCNNGHEYTLTNTRIDKHGRRHCKACGRINHKLKYHETKRWKSRH